MKAYVGPFRACWFGDGASGHRLLAGILAGLVEVWRARTVWRVTAPFLFCLLGIWGFPGHISDLFLGRR